MSNTTKKTAVLPVLGLLSALALAGCGGSAAQSGSGITLGITDAPVDGAEHVWVAFTGVEIQPAEGARIVIAYDEPKRLDLLSLQQGLRDFLLDNHPLEPGDYDWIRLQVNAEADGVFDSSIVLAGGSEYELYVPSGAESGLKLQHAFTVPETGNVDLTIDFDLRKSVHAPRGGADRFNGTPVYRLKPALRAVAMPTEAGTGADSGTDTGGTEPGTESGTNTVIAFSGSVDPAVFTGLSCSDPAVGYALYAYAGIIFMADDMGGMLADPVSTVSLTPDSENPGRYTYAMAYLEPGDYTLSLTCTADLDAPETDDNIVFVGDTVATAVAGATTTVDFGF